MTNDPKQKADNAANSDGEEEEDVFHDARFPAEEETVSEHNYFLPLTTSRILIWIRKPATLRRIPYHQS